MDENEGDGDGDRDNDGDGDAWLRISSDLRLPRAASRLRTLSHPSVVAVLGPLEGAGMGAGAGAGAAVGMANVGTLGGWDCCRCRCCCCTPILLG